MLTVPAREELPLSKKMSEFRDDALDAFNEGVLYLRGRVLPEESLPVLTAELEWKRLKRRKSVVVRIVG